MNRFSATVKSSTQPESWRSSGITATPARAIAPARPVAIGAAVDLDAPVVECAQARQHVTERALTVALDAGDSDDLAGERPRG